MKYYLYTRETETKANAFGFWMAVMSFLLMGFSIAIMGALGEFVFEKAILLTFLSLIVAIVIGGVARNVRLAFSSTVSEPKPDLYQTKVRQETRKERHRRLSFAEQERLRLHKESLETHVIGDADMTMMQAEMYESARNSVSSMYQDVSTPVGGGCGGGSHDVGSTGTSGSCGGGDTSTW